MSEEDQRKRADERFQEALARDGGRDPREYYRERLRQLRESDESAFRRALEHYEKRLVPAVARADTDPLAEWLDYGRVLAELTSPGRTMSIDPSGRAHPYARPVAPDRLVLHLPTSPRERAILVGLPTALSPAQRATYALLVKGEKS